MVLLKTMMTMTVDAVQAKSHRPSHCSSVCPAPYRTVLHFIISQRQIAASHPLTPALSLITPLSLSNRPAFPLNRSCSNLISAICAFCQFRCLAHECLMQIPPLRVSLSSASASTFCCCSVLCFFSAADGVSGFSTVSSYSSGSGGGPILPDSRAALEDGACSQTVNSDSSQAQRGS